MKFRNGNADIEISEDGTRIIEFDGELKLDWPLNIDIRVMNKCSFGLNPKTGTAFCTFCHESARTDGNECDYDALKEKLEELPSGIELAIGGNEITTGLGLFLHWCLLKGFICNLTVNQGHLQRDEIALYALISFRKIKGLGISYRSKLPWKVQPAFLEYPNTVFHVIAGIDSIQDIIGLAEKGVKKVLVLGEKDFGFNLGNVDLTTQSHKDWFRNCRKLFDVFEVVSFDNLALEQLKIKRFFSDRDWETFNQGEHSFYINAVDQTFSPSSRSSEVVSWSGLSVQNYFRGLFGS